MATSARKALRLTTAVTVILAIAFACSFTATREASATELGTAAISAQATSSPAISCKSLSMQVGKTTKLTVSGGTGKLAWKTSNKNVATVTQAGKVTAKKAGTATITATKGGKKLACAVTVAKKASKTLVVYFSHSGTTKSAATKVKAATGGDLLRIFPKKAYTSDYDKLTTLAQKEYRTNAKPARATKVLNMKQYSTVYVGFPVWWDNMPRLVQAFLADYNLKGKTVVPFCTSGGSGIDGSMKAARVSAKGANVLAGRDLTDYSSARVKKWVAGLKTSAK